MYLQKKNQNWKLIIVIKKTCLLTISCQCSFLIWILTSNYLWLCLEKSILLKRLLKFWWLDSLNKNHLITDVVIHGNGLTKISCNTNHVLYISGIAKRFVNFLNSVCWLTKTLTCQHWQSYHMIRWISYDIYIHYFSSI